MLGTGSPLWRCEHGNILDRTASVHAAHMRAFVGRLAQVTACATSDHSCPLWWQRREAAWRREAAAAEHMRLCAHTRLFNDSLPTSRLRLKQVLEMKFEGRYTGEYTPHDYFEPGYACLGDMRIPAMVGDGPKWVCGIQWLQQPCRLLSLGSNFDDSFERAVHATAGCSAYIVDPTLSKSGVVSGVVRSESVLAFQARLAAYGASLNSSVGVGDPATPNAPFRIVGMAGLLQDHFGSPPWRIDVLKVDVEGAELPVLREAFALCKAGLLQVDQLNVEMHTSPVWYPHSFRKLRELHEVFTEALSCGLMLHHKERNLWGCPASQCLEYAWVSIAHARREAMAALTGTASVSPPPALSGDAKPSAPAQAAPAAGTDELLRLLSTSSGHGKELYLVVQVMAGLGNRLRALASAVSFAETVGRRLAIVWDPDIHCNVQLSDLFLPLKGVPVFSGVGVSGVARIEALPGVTVRRVCYNATLCPNDYSVNTRQVNLQRHINVQRHIYQQASIRLAVRHQVGLPMGPKSANSWQETHRLNKEYPRVARSLRPVDDVAAMVQDLRARSLGAAAGAGTPRQLALGIHVRSLANLSLDMPGIDEQVEASHPITKADMGWMPEARQRCRWRNFVEPALSMLSNLHAAATPRTVYVAADMPETVTLLCAELTKRKPSLICSGAPEEARRRCDGDARRGLYCQRLALAEMLILSRARALLYSDESSYSEVVMVMGADAQARQSGCRPKDKAHVIEG